MLLFKKFIYKLILLTTLIFSSIVFANDAINVPILCYHNFNPVIPGSMNLTPAKFAAQINWLKENGFTIVPLKEVVEYLQGTRSSLPSKAIVITIDDGWRSVYKYMFPVIQKLNIPVTLFIYPETISKGKNALTWEELRELKSTGLFDIQGHTYSHPNFKQEKKHLSAESYEKFVKRELANSKAILEKQMGEKITLLAWPFGIYDPYLENAAKEAGYEMAFSIDYRTANRGFRPMAQPRFMILEKQSMQTFMSIVNGATKNKKG